MKKLLWLIPALMIAAALNAKQFRVSHDTRFFDAIRRQELAIVMFYKEGKTHHDHEYAREMVKKVKYLKEDFHDASKQEPYVAFILVNIDKDDLSGIAERYNIQKFPTFMLFRRGKAFKTGPQQQLVKKSGFLLKEDIVDFIEHYFADYIDQILKAKKREAERRAEQARINALNWGPYWGWGWGWGYPYYGYYGYYW